MLYSERLSRNDPSARPYRAQRIRFYVGRAHGRVSDNTELSGFRPSSRGVEQSSDDDYAESFRGERKPKREAARRRLSHEPFAARPLDFDHKPVLHGFGREVRNVDSFASQTMDTRYS